MLIEVKGHLTGVGSHLQSGRSLGMNPGYQAYWQEPLLTEQSCLHPFFFLKFYIYSYVEDFSLALHYS